MFSYLKSFLFPPKLTPEELAEVEKQVEELIKNNEVVVFSKGYCPFCNKAKRLLKELNVSFIAIELDCEKHGSAMQDYLERRTGQRTVPNIFIKQQHIGGCDDLMAAHSNGTLEKLLAA